MNVITIGCESHKLAEIEAFLRDMNMHEKVKLVAVEDKRRVINELKESIHMFDDKRIYEPFSPKRKHMPKGHQRPYKFHP